MPIDGPRSERFATEKVVDDEFEVVADDGVTLIGDELDWGAHSAIFALEFESTDEAIEESGDVGRFTDQLIRWIQREMNEAVVLHSSSVFSTTAKTYQWLRVSTRPEIPNMTATRNPPFPRYSYCDSCRDDCCTDREHIDELPVDLLYLNVLFRSEFIKSPTIFHHHEFIVMHNVGILAFVHEDRYDLLP